MNLSEAYTQAMKEEDDPIERAELSSDSELKTLMVEEIIEAFKEIKANRVVSKDPLATLEPLFKCVAFWFIFGIRVGKILRDQELAEVSVK